MDERDLYLKYLRAMAVTESLERDEAMAVAERALDRGSLVVKVRRDGKPLEKAYCAIFSIGVGGVEQPMGGSWVPAEGHEFPLKHGLYRVAMDDMTGCTDSGYLPSQNRPTAEHRVKVLDGGIIECIFDFSEVDEASKGLAGDRQKNIEEIAALISEGFIQEPVVGFFVGGCLKAAEKIVDFIAGIK